MTRNECRCFLCPAAQPTWNELARVLQAIDSPKTLVDNVWCSDMADQSTGVFRRDCFLAGLASPASASQLRSHLDDHGLWSLFRAPDGLHLVLNHSPKLRALLLNLLPKPMVAQLDGQLQLTCGTTLTRGARAGWQFRAMWASNVWDQVLVANSKPLLLVQSFRRIISLLYASPSLRNAKTLLALTGQCFLHAVLWKSYEQTFQLAEHFLWPHLPFLFRQLAPSLALTEASEALFRPLRRVALYAAERGENSVSVVMQRLLLFLAVKRVRLGLRRKRTIPTSNEPCAKCIAQEHVRTRLQHDLGSLPALVTVLKALGFEEKKSFSVVVDRFVELFDAHVDSVPDQPVLPTLEQLAAEHESEMRKQFATLFPKQMPPQQQQQQQVVAADDGERNESEPRPEVLSQSNFDAAFGTEHEQQEQEEAEAEAAEADEAESVIEEQSDSEHEPATSAAHKPKSGKDEKKTTEAEPAAKHARLRRSTHGPTCPSCGAFASYAALEEAHICEPVPAAAAEQHAGRQLPEAGSRKRGRD